VKKRVLWVEWHRAWSEWTVRVGKQRSRRGAFRNNTRPGVRGYAAAKCRNWWADGVPAQLRIRNKGNGRISEERSYGCDSKRRKG
jgi:hypothetical protein